MSGSVNDAVVALVALWDAAKPSGWLVIDSGPPVDPPLDFLCVAFDRSESPAVTVQAGERMARALQPRESYDVSSVLSLWSGSSSPAAARSDALAAFGVFRAALDADRNLGGTVMDAVVTDYELYPTVSTLGDRVEIRFTTHIEALHA